MIDTDILPDKNYMGETNKEIKSFRAGERKEYDGWCYPECPVFEYVAAVAPVIRKRSEDVINMLIEKKLINNPLKRVEYLNLVSDIMRIMTGAKNEWK